MRASSEAERKQRERERQALLNTMALAEAELAKPEYFGFLIERDRMGYLEALSQTKTTFRGINPHDPFDGIVLNGGINPDFVMMLEKNFFKENSENLDKDELYFVRYLAERDKMIWWLQNQFKELAVDDEYLIKELGISSEELFQRLQANTLVFAAKVENGEPYLIDSRLYVEGVKNQNYYETIPQNFCSYSNTKIDSIRLNDFIEKRRKEKEKAIIEKESEKNKFLIKVVGATLIFIILLFLLLVKFA